MPDLWDPNPDNTFNGSGTKPDSAPNGNHDHTKEVRLRDHRVRLQPPAYVLIALVIALWPSWSCSSACCSPPISAAGAVGLSIPRRDVESPWGLGRSNQETLAASGEAYPGARCLVPGPGARFESCRTASWGEAVLGSALPGLVMPCPSLAFARVAGTLGAWLLQARTMAMAAVPSSRNAT